jgi:hypothetical protein
MSCILAFSLDKDKMVYNLAFIVNLISYKSGDKFYKPCDPL